MKLAKFALTPIAAISVAIFAAFAAFAGNVVYVAPDGSNTSPYDTWDKATTNLQTAADLYEEATVVVRGELPVLNTRLVLDKKTFVYGEDGAVAPLKRGVSIANAGVVVSNLTLKGHWWGYNSSGAHGVQLNAAGLLTHCTVTNFFTCFGNDAQDITAFDGGGVGIRAAGAVVRNCTIAGNTCWGNGCGIYIGANALVEKCLITGNRDNAGLSTPAGIGAYVAGGGTLRNCLVVKNGSNKYSVINTGVVVANGLMESCTVADNFAGTMSDGKALKVSWNGRVKNCIVCNNTNKNGTDTHLLDIPSDGVTYTSVSPAISGKGNTTDAPVFVPGTYKLADCSLVDKGSKQAWMDGATDFYGTMRVLGEAVDMGASEYKPAAYVTVTGSPAAYGTADPDYGKVDAWDGEKTFTCPASYTDGETVNAVCAGWKLRKGDGTELSGEGNAVNLTYSDDLEYATLTWLWAVTRLTDRYVKPDGDDMADGKTWATAWATPQKAIDAYPEATAADEITVYLGEGTFTDAQTILNVTNAVRIIGAGKGKTYLVPDNTSEAPTVLLAHPAGVVSGVSIIGNTKAAAVRFSGNAGRLEGSCVGTNSYLGVQFSDPSTGVVSRCEISGNVGSYGGLQMHCNTANRCYVENTLFKDNRASNDRGGACFTYYGGKGVFNFCTFVGNSGPRGAYSGHYTSNVVFNNCIFSGNTCTSTLLEMNFSLVSSSITVDHCWTFDGYGQDPVAGAPNFTDPVGGDFTLRYGSCCRDAAKTLGGEAAALDLLGNSRLSGAAPDVGCYEFQEEGLQCDVLTSADELASGAEVTLTAVCSQSGDYTYAWTLKDSSGATVATGTDAVWTVPVEANGYLSVELMIKDWCGETTIASIKVANIVLIRPARTFVKPAGTEGVTPEYPYDTWAKATTSIEDAIEAVTTGGTVMLADGVHTLTEQLKIEKAVTVRSQNGRDKTVIEQTVKGPRVLKLNNAQAVVTGVTLRRGRIDTYYARKDGDSGAGVWITGAGGTVSDCRITDCAPSNYGSGVVTIGSSGGHVTRCIIDDNSYSRYWSNPYGSGSAGVVISSGRIDSCLVRGNSGVKNSGIEVSGSAKVVNCTVVDNVTTSESGGGLKIGALTSGQGLVQNVIVCGSTGKATLSSSVGYPEWMTTVTDAAGLKNVSNAVVTCTFGKDFTWPLGETCVNEDPLFTDAAAGDYTLNGGSKLIDAGTDYEGVEDETDLAGLPRKSGVAVDLGCHEFDLSKRSVAFTVSPSLALAGDDVTFSGNVQGGDPSTEYTYGWTVRSAVTETVVLSETGNPLVVRTLDPGRYDITLAVTETDGGDPVDTKTVSNALQVGARTNYVVAAEGYVGDGGTWPYDTWEKAATNVLTALEAAVPGGTVAIGPGEHVITNAVCVTNAITVVGTEGWKATTLRHDTKAGAARVVYLNHTQARVAGLSLTGGNHLETHGLAVCIDTKGGTLDACRVTGNHWPSTAYIGRWGAVLVKYDASIGPGGTVENCMIDDNLYNRGFSYNYYSSGGAVCLEGGLFRNNIVFGNSGCQYGGVGLYGPAVVVNNTIVSNRCYYAAGPGKTNGAGGIALATANASARVENNLIAFNYYQPYTGEGPVACDAIINSNADQAYVEEQLVKVTANIQQVTKRCLFSDGNVIGIDPVSGAPVFRTRVMPSAPDTNWRQRSRSPGYKTGLYDASWMADGVDIYGEPRTKHTSQLDGPLVDIGAAEADWRGSGLMILVW